MGKNLYYLGKYKSKIISMLLNNHDLVKLINPKIISNLNIDDILLGGTYEVPGTNDSNIEKIEVQGHIFDYLFVPNVTCEDKVFICIETLVDSCENQYFSDFIMYINIYVAKSLLHLESNSSPSSIEMSKLGYVGNRLDMLCDAIDRLLNGNSSFGIGDVTPIPYNFITLDIPDNKYYGKCLRYKVKNYIDRDGCNM